MKRLIITLSILGIIIFTALLIPKAYNGSITRPGVKHEPSKNVAVVIDTEEKEYKNFSWKDESGNIYSLKEKRGKVVLINFWATWCVPCRKEIPHLVSINRSLDPDKLYMIGISIDQGKNAVDKVNHFIADYDIDYTNIIDDGSLSRLFGNIHSIPTTILIDREGRLAETIVGFQTEEYFMENISRLIQ